MSSISCKTCENSSAFFDIYGIFRYRCSYINKAHICLSHRYLFYKKKEEFHKFKEIEFLSIEEMEI